MFNSGNRDALFRDVQGIVGGIYAEEIIVVTHGSGEQAIIAQEGVAFADPGCCIQLQDSGRVEYQRSYLQSGTVVAEPYTAAIESKRTADTAVS